MAHLDDLLTEIDERPDRDESVGPIAAAETAAGTPVALDELDTDELGTPVAAGPVSATRRRRRRLWLSAAAAALVLLAAVGGTLVALLKTVTVTVDGTARSVTTLSGSVAGALQAADVSVGEHDTLAPAADADLADGAAVVVNRGRLLTLTLDGKPVQLWTTARTVEEAFAELGRNPDDFQLSADRSRAIPLTASPSSRRPGTRSPSSTARPPRRCR